MKKNPVIFIILFSSMVSMSAQNEDMAFKGIASRVSSLREKMKNGTVAVFPFEAHGFKKSSYGLYVSDKLAAAILSENKLILVEREKLHRVMKEKELSLSGVVKQNEARKIGSLLAIDAIILGRVYRKQRGYEVVVKVVDTESGTLLTMITRKYNDDTGKDTGFTGSWKVIKTAPYLTKQQMSYEKLVLRKDSSFSLHMVNNADRFVEITGRYRVDKNNINYRALKIYLDGSKTSFMRLNSRLRGTIYLVKGMIYFTYSGKGKKKMTRLDAMDLQYRSIGEKIE